MGISRDLRVKRLVIGGGNDQHTPVKVRLNIAAQDLLTATAVNQFAQLRFYLGCDNPQYGARIGQQPGFAQGNLPTADH